MVETNDMLELCKYTDGDFLLARVWKISFKIILKILLFWILPSRLKFSILWQHTVLEVEVIY